MDTTGTSTQPPPPAPEVVPQVKKTRKRAETQSSTDISISATGSFEKGGNSTTNGEDEAIIVPRWFPRCCGKPILHGKPEALGWLLSMSGQTMGILGVGTFVIPALIYFARIEAGCEVEIPEGETELPECNNKAYGLKPSSMITTLTSVLSLCVAVLTPLLGAFVDYTHHRRRFGRILSCAYVCLVIPLCFMSEDTWFPLTVCILFMVIVAQTLTLVLHAYLPDLTDSEDELNDLTKAFIALPGLQNMIFIIVVIAITVGMGYGGQEGPAARIAALLGAFVLGIYFFLAWGFLMQPRPALNTLEPGQILFLQGFQQIYRTMTKLYHTNVPLLWFYAAVALGDVKPLTGIGLTFLSSQQQFNSTDLGIASMIMLLSLVPGAIVSSFVCRKVNPVRSSVLAVLTMMIVTGAAALFLTGPNQKPQTFVAVACWGIAGGWKVTSTAMLVAAIVPEGQDAELMGFYLFADTALSWAPPLIFTAMNEAGMSERAGLSSIICFWVLGLFAYWKMGSYDDRVKAANRLVVVASAEDDEEAVAKALASNKEASAPMKEVTSNDPNTTVTKDASSDEQVVAENNKQQPAESEQVQPPTVQMEGLAVGDLSASTNNVHIDGESMP